MSMFSALRLYRTRLLHSSPVSLNLIGPPDPVTHLRPILYDEPPPTPALRSHHPYSLREFNGDTRDEQLQWRLQKQQLESFNHDFWTDNNTRFEAAKQAVLDSLPETSSVLDREHALSEFYARWVMQESDRHIAYTDEWRRRNLLEIANAARIEYRRLKSRIASLFL